MPTKPMSVWVPVGYVTALSAIALVGNIASAFISMRADAGMIPFLCFLPMAFYFVAEYQRQTREQIKSLEDRIQQLEAKEA